MTAASLPRPGASRFRLTAAALLVAFCLPLVFAKPLAAAVPLPRGLEAANAARTPEAAADVFLGIPYRDDGAINERGEYTLFADQRRRFDSPGLNCSGLVLGIVRVLTDRNISLDDARRDRLADSGPGAAGGEDWDFGWDLIMNVSEGLPRRILLPGMAELDPARATGLEPRGYTIASGETWKELPERLREGHIYLVSLNVEGRRKGYGLQHYHVGVIVPGPGRAFFYQTTGKGRHANKRDLKSAAGQSSFKKAFADTGGKQKKMVVLEVRLPEGVRP